MGLGFTAKEEPETPAKRPKKSGGAQPAQGNGGAKPAALSQSLRLRLKGKRGEPTGALSGSGRA